jgi:molybdenum cofactor guanylyltransferase
VKVAGFVLAGGKSSRMGQDKAFLRLRGIPLIRIAIDRLQMACDPVSILGNNSALSEFGSLIPDETADCGPLSGIVQALRHSSHDWSLITPVDVPLLPPVLLRTWVEKVLNYEQDRQSVCCLAESGQAQPLICLLHRSTAQYLADALHRGERKVLPLLQGAGRSQNGFRMIDLNDPWWQGTWNPTPQEDDLRDLWFGNANTLDELANLEQRLVDANERGL